MNPRLRRCLSCLLALLLVGCGGIGGHSPVSPRTMRRLQASSISRDDFTRRLRGVDHDIRFSLPQKNLTVPFELESGTPVIKAAGPDDRPMTMLLDTGAARMVLGADTALKSRIPTIDASQVQATMLGVVGNEQGLVGLISPFRIATWTVPAYPCFVRTYETFGEGFDYPSNILGLDLIERYCTHLTIDYGRREITFGFQGSFRPANTHSASTPLSIRQGVAFIEVRSKGVKWSCVLDTGSFNGIEIDEATAKKLGVQDQGRIVEGLTLIAVGGLVSSEKARLRTVTLPEVRLLGGSYKQAEVDIAPGIPRIGSYFLKDYRVTLDFRKKRVWLEW